MNRPAARSRIHVVVVSGALIALCLPFVGMIAEAPGAILADPPVAALDAAPIGSNGPRGDGPARAGTPGGSATTPPRPPPRSTTTDPAPPTTTATTATPDTVHVVTLPPDETTTTPPPPQSTTTSPAPPTTTATTATPDTVHLVTLPPDETTTTPPPPQSTTTHPAPPTTTAPPAPAPPPTPDAGRTYGWAEWAGLRGGLDGASYVVTSSADSGPGTYRDAISAGDRYITFDARLDGAIIRLDSPVTSDASHLTIDGSGVDVTVTRFATKFSGTDIVVAGMTYRDMDGSDNEDALTFRDASTTQVFGLFGNVFRTATDGLVDVIWNGGNDVYATICDNRFERHDKAMLVHSGADEREGGTYHVTLCRNVWQDVYQRAPFTRDAIVHQYDDVFVDYGKPDGAGGGSKAGGASFPSQHLVEQPMARPRSSGAATWDGSKVTSPRVEFVGPHSGSPGSVRVIGGLFVPTDGVQPVAVESTPERVTPPPYHYEAWPATRELYDRLLASAGSCNSVGTRALHPCA